jgi:hypothetical protein
VAHTIKTTANAIATVCIFDPWRQRTSRQLLGISLHRPSRHAGGVVAGRCGGAADAVLPRFQGRPPSVITPPLPRIFFAGLARRDNRAPAASDQRRQQINQKRFAVADVVRHDQKHGRQIESAAQHYGQAANATARSVALTNGKPDSKSLYMRNAVMACWRVGCSGSAARSCRRCTTSALPGHIRIV